MVKRRVLISALPCAVGSVVSPSSAVRADPPVPDFPSPPPAYDSWGIDATGEAPPAQDAQIGVAADAYADTDPSALSDFRATLDSHGTWAQDPTFGTVWVPSPDEVGADFTPYVTSGHWAYDNDYVWISDYVWGWVAFHYGRWERIREMGWAWIPGRAYAGAWVSWRLGTGEFAFVGWAPLPPAWAWRDGFAVATGLGPWQPFVYCLQGEVFAPAIATRVVSGAPAAAIAPHTRTYVPATPSVDGATPPPGPPSKAATGRPVAGSAAHGPSPALLGIDPSQVVHRSGTDRGLASALAYARPSTARPLGAHAPIAHVVRAIPAVVPQYAEAPAARAPKRR